ncbi:UNVERIFIED_CONTAM: hypothetical protein PYX00_007963 [Menopon gallinae]|uniref:CID domain-containing protein n=1 Tax=Menopon gallinae TaxID=328185 RepID=A0AAW2HLB7_9NEOP
MATFSESALVKKLADLNPSQQSIQTLSLWLIHHRKHYAAIVKVWYKELVKASEKRKITFIYLANDVIQNSKKKGPEYGKEFGGILPKAFEHMSTLENFDEKSKKNLERVLNIWEERGVYDMKQIAEFKKVLVQKKKKTNDEEKKKHKKDKYSPVHVRERKKSDTETQVEVNGMREVHVTLSPRTPAGDPPEPEEIIKALMDLENSASSDVAVREAIASLPPEVSDVSLLMKLQDRAAAEQLSKQVNAAVQLLSEYNNRLASELEDRKKVTAMLRDFTESQNELLSHAKQRLEEYQEKLQKVHQVRQEVRSHLQNLPDLTQLPDVTGGLAPLPSAGDLFNLHS